MGLNRPTLYMFTQILKILTPELIIQAVKDNPKVIVETLHKFDTFKLIGASLTESQQLVLSGNTSMVNKYLATDTSKAAIRVWAEGFCDFIRGLEAAKVAEIAKVTEIDEKEELRLKMRAELEAEIRNEIRNEVRSISPTSKVMLDMEDANKNITAVNAKSLADLDAITKQLQKSK